MLAAAAIASAKLDVFTFDFRLRVANGLQKKHFAFAALDFFWHNIIAQQARRRGRLPVVVAAEFGGCFI